MKVQRGSRVIALPTLDIGVRWGEVNHCTEAYVGLRAVWTRVEKRKPPILTIFQTPYHQNCTEL